MPISRSRIRDIVRDAIEEVTDAVVDEEIEEIAETAAQKFIEEDPNAYDDEDDNRDVPPEDADAEPDAKG